MPIPPRIRAWLAQHDARHEILSPAASVPARSHVRAALLKDARGYLLAVFPASHALQPDQLNGALGRELAPASAEEAAQVFADAEPGSAPVLGAAYAVETCIDQSVDALRMVVFDSGAARARIEVTAPTFARLQAAARRGLRFAVERDSGAAVDNPLARLPCLNIKTRLTHAARLPAVPEVAQRLLRLRNDPKAGVRDLANVVRVEPSMAAQILRYANSPLFGHRGRIQSIDHAVVVLGYEAALNVATGIALGAALRLPASGRLGLANLWRHAIHSAACCELLARELPSALRVKPGIAYLTGLLQNIGYVLLAHAFNKELFWLHKALTFHPQLPVLDVERHVLGLTHMEIGAELLRHWRLPEEIVAGVQHHHEVQGAVAHAPYAALVLLANRALARNGIGEETDDTLPSQVIQALGLTERVVVTIAERLLDAHAELDQLAQHLAA